MLATPYLYRQCQRMHLIDALYGWFVIILWSSSKASLSNYYYWLSMTLYYRIPPRFLFPVFIRLLLVDILTLLIMVMILHLLVIGTVPCLWLVSLLPALKNKSVRNSVNLCLSRKFPAFAVIFPHSSIKLVTSSTTVYLASVEVIYMG